MLEVEDLDVRYGQMSALRHVSLDITEGECVAVLGGNGAGKSTLLRAISGLVPISGGHIRFDGREVAGRSPDALVRAGIAHVPEGRELFPGLTVRENLEVGGLNRSRAQRRASVEQVVALFPIIGERLTQQAGTMSGGEQQMLAIGRALMSAPRLALIDEMSLGVAPIVVGRLFEVVAELRESGTTVLLVEQHARQALRVADRAWVLQTGEVVLHGNADELSRDESVRRAYLGGLEDAGEEQVS
ncbi:MAG: ATP-binding cassette domain-containing protein [Streptosporangiales bacterium]|nr:ATP-binding cassette domain-containing protein [Streptosporangiales bacterium]